MDIDFEDSPAIGVDVLGVVVFEILERDLKKYQIPKTKKEPKLPLSIQEIQSFI